VWVRWLLVVCALALSGCRLDLVIEVDVTRDGSGEVVLSLTADDELLGRARAAEIDPLGEVAEVGRALGDEGWEVEDTDQVGSRTVELSTGFDDPAEFDALMAELAAGLDAPELSLLAPFAMTMTEDRLAVEGAVGLQPEEAVAELGMTPEDAVARLDSELDGRYEVRVTMPGDIIETTAPRRHDTTLVWDVGPGEDVAVRAVSDRPGIPIAVLAAGALVGLVTTLAAFVLVRRRR
jgi:hypothetical protein